MKKEKHEKEPVYKYTLVHTFNRQHSNFAYKERNEVPPHRHDFKIELKISCKDITKCEMGDNNYQVDLALIFAHLKEFLELLPDNLNDHEILGRTSCSAEDILDYVGIYFLPYLKEQGVKNIKIKKIKIWETESTAVSLSDKKLRQKLKKTRADKCLRTCLIST